MNLLRTLCPTLKQNLGTKNIELQHHLNSRLFFLWHWRISNFWFNIILTKFTIFLHYLGQLQNFSSNSRFRSTKNYCLDVVFHHITYLCTRRTISSQPTLLAATCKGVSPPAWFFLIIFLANLPPACWWRKTEQENSDLGLNCLISQSVWIRLRWVELMLLSLGVFRGRRLWFNNTSPSLILLKKLINISDQIYYLRSM